MRGKLGRRRAGSKVGLPCAGAAAQVHSGVRPSCCRPAPRVLFALLALLAGTPAGSEAQAVITGRAVDDSTGAPVAGAEVVLEAGRRQALTDAAGRFELSGVPLGTGFVIVRKVGYRPVRLRALIFGPDTLTVDVRLRPAVMELEPIEVTAAAVPPGLLPFAERRAAGQGAFLDWHLLRESEHRRVSDLLRTQRGVRLVPVGATKTVATTNRGRCPMAIWIDGVRTFVPGSGISPPSIDEIPVAQLEAIEIYRGAAETPAELGGTGAACGTIVFWTRRR